MYRETHLRKVTRLHLYIYMLTTVSSRTKYVGSQKIQKKRTIQPNDIVETDYCSSFRCLELIVVSSHLDRKIRLKFVYTSLESPCSSSRIHPDITIDEILLILLAVVAFKSISRYPARRLALLSPTRIALESLFELS